MKDSYSQLGEDLVVDHYLSEKDKGLYVDIGAYDPIFLSNTYKFYKRGWRGICVEPNALKAEKYRAERPDDQFFPEACGTGDLKFKLSSVHDALSSTSGDGTPVKSRPLSEYLAMLPSVDLLSIDCEGMEMNILNSNDWTKFRPTMVILEVIDYITKRKHTELIDFMLSKNYGLVCDNSINAIFLEDALFNKIFLL